MIIGVGSRLIPMFLISKYENPKHLWWIYSLINAGLISFIFIFFSSLQFAFFLIPIVLIGIGVVLFGNHIYQSYTQRIRKKVDDQVKISMLSVILTIAPIFIMLVIILLFTTVNSIQLSLLYGFFIFFGWITSIIIGMTFKTMPFIIWNKVYSPIAGLGKTPNPKEIFSNKVFVANCVSYFIGFIVFSLGILLLNIILLKIGATFLLITAVLYNFNVFKLLFLKAK
jgi:hypothetical protein